MMRRRSNATFYGLTHLYRRPFHASSINGTSSYKTSQQQLPPSTVVLLRHGQSIWNQTNKFSGWCDVPLTKLGIDQAKDAGDLLKQKGFCFDHYYSSELKRAYETAETVMDVVEGINSRKLTKNWSLNERHYGALQGLSKQNPELVSMYGIEQMNAWRREMFEAPPPMMEIHPYYRPPPAPKTESLYDCQLRVLRFWHGTIVPAMASKKKILIAAHANTMRSLIAYLDDIPHEEVPNIHVPNSIPVVFKIDPNNGQALHQDLSPFKKSKGHWLLSNENTGRLVDKLGSNSECFARSVFAAWDTNKDGVLQKEEIAWGLNLFKRDPNPAIAALTSKLLEELRNIDDLPHDITLEKFQCIAISGCRKHNLPFFENEEIFLSI